MQVKCIAECSALKHSAILLTFIKFPFSMKTFILSIFEWPFKTGFVVVTLALGESLALVVKCHCCFLKLGLVT